MGIYAGLGEKKKPVFDTLLILYLLIFKDQVPSVVDTSMNAEHRCPAFKLAVEVAEIVRGVYEGSIAGSLFTPRAQT